MYYAAMRSIASYVPTRCVPNAEFEKTLDTSDEWITKRTGIKTRYFASDDQSGSDLGVEAARLALSRANLTPKDIDLVVCATLSPDFLAMPSNACLISAKLGITDVPAFDITAACTGFIYLLSVAKSFVESGAYHNVLIVGAEKISSVLDFSDRGTCVLFGDGAGAAVISRTDNPKEAILDVHISANGAYSDLLMTPQAKIQSTQKGEIQGGKLQMKGNEVFKHAVRTLTADVEHILQRNNLSTDSIDLFIPHQANLRIINAVGEQLGLGSEKIILTVQKYGNTSAASIPMAIDEAYKAKRINKGDLLLLDAFGGGFTWGSALVYFGGAPYDG
ncbi:beta-ketoacyl-ACP synthase III [Helicobacter sp.]|uniref:beta-ketoacyl-ACP synthase III n=1 Tax=Helicobacter sp. TaxID=218 RepID=UPI00388FCABE